MAAGKQLLQKMLKFLQEGKSFDGAVLNHMRIVSGGEGKCTAEMKVAEEHQNRGGTLHGGCTATLVDMVTTMALMTHHLDSPLPGVSVDMHVSFLKAARVGDELVLEATTRKAGKTLAFLDISIRNKSSGDLIALGSHTKYIGK